MFAEAMAERLGVDPDGDLRPAALASLASSVVRVALRKWAADGLRRPDEIAAEAFTLLQEQLSQPPG